MRKQWLYFLLVFLLPVLAVLWWWGLFSSASVALETRGGYRYAYMDAEGAYSKLADKQQEVLFYLKQQGIAAGAQITLILTDPRTTPYENLLARTGYQVSATDAVKPPLKVDSIPLRPVVVASIKAHPLFAYGKTYSALLAFAKQKNRPLQLPTVEIFHASVLSVEMPLVKP